MLLMQLGFFGFLLVSHPSACLSCPVVNTLLTGQFYFTVVSTLASSPGRSLVSLDFSLEPFSHTSSFLALQLWFTCAVRCPLILKLALNSSWVSPGFGHLLLHSLMSLQNRSCRNPLVHEQALECAAQLCVAPYSYVLPWLRIPFFCLRGTVMPSSGMPLPQWNYRSFQKSILQTHPWI